MANLDLTTLAPKIAQAKSAGYSDDEIVNFLSDQAPEKFKQAKAAGYSSGEILAHLTTAAPKTAQPDDHGLAHRQQMTTAEKAVSPITEYPRNYEEMRTEAQRQVSRGAEQFSEAVRTAKPLYEAGGPESLWEGAKGIGNIGLGALGYVASPISAIYRSVAGQPIEDVTGIPREYTEFAAQLATPGIGLTGKVPVPGEVVPGQVPRLYVSPASRDFRTGPEPPPPAAPEVAQAGQRLTEGYSPVAVPRAVASDKRAIQEIGQKGSKIPIVGEPVAQAVEDVAPQLGKARAAVAEDFGSGTAPNAASRIEQHLTKTAAEETQAAQAAADAQHQAATAEWQRATQEREAQIAAQEQQSTQAAQQSVGPDVDPQDMGAAVIDQVRANERAAQADKNRLYDDAGSRQGTVFNEAIANADRHVNAGIAGDVTVRPRLTPAAFEMQRSLRQFSSNARNSIAEAEARAEVQGGPVERSGLNLQAIETQRKELGRLANGATNDEDARAASHIMDHFDDWQERVMQPGRNFEGDPDALGAYVRARAANRDWRQRFGYNNRDDADKLINKIVRGQDDQHTGPVAVSDALMAKNDKSGPLVSRVLEATNNDPNVLQAIRSGTWNKLSQAAPGTAEPRTLAEAVTRAKAARKEIYSYLHGKGRDVAGRVFTQEQRDLMHAHADTLLGTATQRHAAADLAEASQPVAPKVQPGPIQQLADAVIRGKSNEEFFKAIEGFAKSKNLGGDVQTLADVMRHIPPEMKGDFVHNFIQRLGRTSQKGFSPDAFATEWENITPQAKAVLFGNAGPHIQALNDIATISRRMKDVQGKFGNPSGSGGVLNFSHGLYAAIGSIAAGNVVMPLKAIAAAAPFLAASKILASPIGASSAARFARVAERLNRTPNIANATAAQLALRNVVNTARSISAQQPRK